MIPASQYNATCIYLLSIILQIEGWRGAAGGVCQELSAPAAPRSPHQQEASWREPAHMAISPLHQVMTCGPARGSQGDTAGSSRGSTAYHRPVLGVAVPDGGERGH